MSIICNESASDPALYCGGLPQKYNNSNFKNPCYRCFSCCIQHIKHTNLNLPQRPPLWCPLSEFHTVTKNTGGGLPWAERPWKKGCHIRRRSHGKREDPISGPLISNKPTVRQLVGAKYSTRRHRGGQSVTTAVLGSGCEPMYCFYQHSESLPQSGT